MNSSMFFLIIEKLRILFKWVSGLSLFCIIPLTTFDVLRRIITGHGLSATTQGVEMLMLATVFFALGEAQINKKHIDIGLLVDHLSSNIQAIYRIIVCVICMGLGFIFVVYTSIRVIDSMISAETMWMGLSTILIWPFRLIVPIGFLYWTLCLVKELIVNTKRSVNK